MTPRKWIRARLSGRLREEDLEDVCKLEKVVDDCKGDFEDSLRALREATYYVDDLVVNPRLLKDVRYRVWSRALDCFITEMRCLVDVNKDPIISDSAIIDMLIWRLSMMRIHETMQEQVEVRLNLEDAVVSMFSLKKKHMRKLRMNGY